MHADNKLHYNETGTGHGFNIRPAFATHPGGLLMQPLIQANKRQIIICTETHTIRNQVTGRGIII